MNTKSFLGRAALPGLFAALVAAAPLKADEWLKFGAGLHIANPSGDLTNEKELSNKVKMGFGLSVFGELGLNDKMALRGRVDYNIFGEGEKKESEFGYTSTNTLNANATTVFCDYIYSFDSHEKGFYAFAGLGIVSGKLKFDKKEELDGGSPSGSDSESGSNLGFSLGIGYNLNSHIGFEASYVTASNVIKPEESVKTYGFDYMQVSFKYRF